MFCGELDGLSAQGQKGWVQVVESSRKKIGIHRGQFEARVAQVHRGIKWGSGSLPLATKPLFDKGLVLEEVSFDLLQGAGQGGGEMGYRMDMFNRHGAIVTVCVQFPWNRDLCGQWGTFFR